MKIIKRVFLGILFIAVIIGITLFLFNYIQEQRMLEIVRSGNLVIDQKMHEWNVCNDNAPLSIEMYVRNKGEYKITGKLVFLITLSTKGLEKSFLSELVNCGGEEDLKRELPEAINTSSNNELQAWYNFIMRGKKLPQGQEYEPSTRTDGKDYTFKFRKRVLIGPGEILKINHEEQIPPIEQGHLLSVKIENIEF